MRVGYARVSTADQSPELQLEALRHADCEKVFSEKASGAKADRPELTRVLRDVLRQGDVLVVWKLDRLARSLKKLITTAEELEERGIGLVSLTESIDTTTPGGMLVFHVFGAIAQFERALIRERTAAGLAEARRRGRADNEAAERLERLLYRLGYRRIPSFRHLADPRCGQPSPSSGD